MSERALRLPADVVAAAIVLVSILLIHWSTFSTLVVGWMSSATYNHGFLILPLALLFAWQRWGVAAAQPRHVLWPGLLVVAGLSLVWTAAALINVQIVSQFASIGLVSAVMLAMFGYRLFLTMALPLFYLFFMIPVGEELVPPLMRITADIVVGSLNLFGLPVLREGLHFSTSNGNFEVATACSGVRYLTASIAAGTAFAFLTYSSARKRAIFLVASVVVPIVANGIRAFIIVLIAEFSNLRLAVGIDHFIYGWIFFGIVIFLMFFIGSRFADPVEDVTAPQVSGPGSDDARSARRGRVAFVAVVCIVLIASGPAMVSARQAGDFAAEIRLPHAQGTDRVLSMFNTTADDWTIHYPGAASTVAARYEHAGAVVELRIAVFTVQRQGSEWIYWENRIAAAPWSVESDGSRNIAGAAIPSVRASTITRDRAGMSVWQWYQLGDKVSHSRYEAKLLELTGLLSRQPALVVAIATDGDEADGVLESFLEAYGAVLRDCLAGKATAADCRPVRGE